MLDFTSLYIELAKDARLQPWLSCLIPQLEQWHNKPHKDRDRWFRALKKINYPMPNHLDLVHSVTAYCDPKLPEGERKKLTSLLQQFHPWRKGPYQLHGIHIDTEWRSDWKWERLLPHITPLTQRRVLDVGCGNGYHLWRMLGAGAQLAIGIDPSDLFIVQFEAVRRLLGQPTGIHLLPLGIEQLPELNAFDTVFSMGVLYHRRSPLDHLVQLQNQLVSGGELILETLVIEGDEQSVLVPQGRYAQMHNVYFFPSSLALKTWLEKVGFVDVRIVDESITSIEEQRSTPWMTHHSLPDYLDPKDPSKTIEGHPAPRRAIIIANKA